MYKFKKLQEVSVYKEVFIIYCLFILYCTGFFLKIFTVFKIFKKEMKLLFGTSAILGLRKCI